MVTEGGNNNNRGRAIIADADQHRLVRRRAGEAAPNDLELVHDLEAASRRGRRAAHWLTIATDAGVRR